jgi:hypothetical protein
LTGYSTSLWCAAVIRLGPTRPLFRYLDKQPLAADLVQLQAQVDTFDHI